MRRGAWKSGERRGTVRAAATARNHLAPKLKPERCVPAKRLNKVWPYDLTCERVVNDRLTIKIKLNSLANSIFRTFR
jgi:hypothetical protein